MMTMMMFSNFISAVGKVMSTVRHFVFSAFRV